jgi:ribosomal protein L37E
MTSFAIKNMSPTIVCADCGNEAQRTGPRQKYCKSCSDTRNEKRQTKWAREHRPSKEQMNARTAALAPEIRNRGLEENRKNATGSWTPQQPELAWVVRVAIPFDPAFSKNRVYSNNGKGHVSLRDEARRARESLMWTLKEALRGVQIAQRKTWLDIFVQKPHHLGDAINFIDNVCDAVKDSIGVDDRWFSIRMLDWEIVYENPRIFVGIGQESNVATRICSTCGQPRTFEEFTRNAHDKLFGTSRICKICMNSPNART